MTVRLPFRLALAGLAGAAMGSAFPPYGWWWCAPLGVVLLVLALRDVGPRSAAVLGGVAWVTFTLVAMGWLRVVGWDALAALTVLMAIWGALVGIAVRLALAHRLWPLLVPAVIVAQESLRAQVPFGGLPWARLGFALADSPLLPIVAWIGVPGASVLLAAVGTTALWLITAPSRRPRRTASIAVAAVGSVVLLSAGTASASLQVEDTGSVVEAAVVQGGVVNTRDRASEMRAVLDAHVSQTLGLATGAEGPDLVVWPESATDIDPFMDQSAQAAVVAAVSAVEAPIVVGAVTQGSGGDNLTRNEVVVWDPQTGPGDSYAKRHLVPFGEFVPAREALSAVLPRLSEVTRDFVPGASPGVLSVSGIQLGTVICFEVAFDGIVRDTVAAGAEILAVPSNNATYVGTAQPLQQLAMSRVRAVEFGRWVLVASTTGVSAIIRPDGEIVAQVPEGRAGALAADVTARRGATGAMLTAPLVESGGLVVLGVMLALGWTRRRRGLPPMDWTSAESPSSRAR